MTDLSNNREKQFMKKYLALLLCSLVVFVAQLEASSLIETRLAEIKDVRLLLSIEGRLDPPTGVDLDLFHCSIKETCSSLLRESGIGVQDSSSRTLVVSVGIDKGKQKGESRWIAVSVRLELRETLWEKVPSREVSAYTWQMEDILLLEEEEFGPSVQSSISFLIEEFCGRVSQAREYLEELESGGIGDTKSVDSDVD